MRILNSFFISKYSFNLKKLLKKDQIQLRTISSNKKLRKNILDDKTVDDEIRKNFYLQRPTIQSTGNTIRFKNYIKAIENIVNSPIFAESRLQNTLQLNEHAYMDELNHGQLKELSNKIRWEQVENEIEKNQPYKCSDSDLLENNCIEEINETNESHVEFSEEADKIQVKYKANLSPNGQPNNPYSTYLEVGNILDDTSFLVLFDKSANVIYSKSGSEHEQHSLNIQLNSVKQ